MSVYAPTLGRGYFPAKTDPKAKRLYRPVAITGGGDDPTPMIGEVNRQLESPLNALICQRERKYLDEIPTLQRESLLYALVNQRQQIRLDLEAANQLENPLTAQINEREPQPYYTLPVQLESPLNATINGHTQPVNWRVGENKPR